MLFNPDASRILHIDLSSGEGDVILLENRHLHLGGSGLCAALYEKYGHPDLPCNDPSEPIIFAIGPLTGLFPLMNKTVCGFRSPLTGQWAESHAGGRLAMSLRFSGYDALMITGKAASLSALTIGSRTMEIKDVHYLRGRGVFGTGRELRRFGKGSSGRRTILRIGPAGENGVKYACINVDSFRHFGRLGSGMVMGEKNLKGIVIMGDAAFDLPEDGKNYGKLYKEIFTAVTDSGMMKKYHDLGTPENLAPLNAMKALPWRNLTATEDAGIATVTGEHLAENYLLRKAACAGCPVGCIHIGNLRRQFGEDHEYLYKQVSYDYELIFAQGTMLGLTDPTDIFTILDETESCGMDSMSTGVALAWATEALQKGLISVDQHTLLPLNFGDPSGYIKALRLLCDGKNEFWADLGQGTMYAAKKYGGEDFACVLGGQEMAGYATGETYFVSHALGFRHSHLDSGGYSHDQTSKEYDAPKAVDFLKKDECNRVALTSMVGCMFARKVYNEEKMQECLRVTGFAKMADALPASADAMRNLRWKLKFATGFVPENQAIPKRFTEVVNWKGPINVAYLKELFDSYSAEIKKMAGIIQ